MGDGFMKKPIISKISKKRKVVFAVSAAAIVFAAAIVVLFVMFFNAKPVFGHALFRPTPEKTIIACTFDGMSFEPALSYAARNYPATESFDGKSSRSDTFYNTVNDKIQEGLSEYLEGRYSEYYVDMVVSENSRKRSVLTFDGDAVPIGTDGRTIINFKLIIDWNKASENSGDDFIEFVTKMPITAE